MHVQCACTKIVLMSFYLCLNNGRRFRPGQNISRQVTYHHFCKRYYRCCWIGVLEKKRYYTQEFGYGMTTKMSFESFKLAVGSRYIYKALLDSPIALYRLRCNMLNIWDISDWLNQETTILWPQK